MSKTSFMTTIAGHDIPPAAKTALEAPSDRSLRVPCYCEENVWRLAYRKMHEQSTSSSTTTTTTAPGGSRSPSISYHVAFVSNPAGCVPMFQQLAAASGSDDPFDPAKPVFWDYHVILISVTNDVSIDRDGHDDCNDDDGGSSTTRAGCASVWDVDSLLPCPCPIDDYLKAVFPNFNEWPKEYAPFFRVVNASLYLRHFSSNRSHMFDPQTGRWSHPPPSYDCILGSQSDDDGTDGTNGGHDRKHTLQRYMTISPADVGAEMEQDIEQKREDSDKAPFGKIYSLPQFQQRFGG